MYRTRGQHISARHMLLLTMISVPKNWELMSDSRHSCTTAGNLETQYCCCCCYAGMRVTA